MVHVAVREAPEHDSRGVAVADVLATFTQLRADGGVLGHLADDVDSPDSLACGEIARREYPKTLDCGLPDLYVRQAHTSPTASAMLRRHATRRAILSDGRSLRRSVRPTAISLEHRTHVMLGAGDTVSGGVAGGSEVSWLSFDAEEGASYTVSARPETLTDIRLRLTVPGALESAAEAREGSVSLGVSTFRRATIAVPVFIAVDSHSDATGSYELSVTAIRRG